MSSDFVIENGILKKYTGAGGDVVIPYGVTGIGYDVFRFSTIVRSLTIPDSVKTIDSRAFCNLNGIETLTFGRDETRLSDFEGVINIIIVVTAVLFNLDPNKYVQVTPKSISYSVTPESIGNARRLLDIIGENRNLYAIWSTYETGVEEALEQYGLKSSFKKYFVCDSFVQGFMQDIMSPDYYHSVQNEIFELDGSDSYQATIFIRGCDDFYRYACFHETIYYDPNMIAHPTPTGWTDHNYDGIIRSFRFYESQWKMEKILKKIKRQIEM